MTTLWHDLDKARAPGQVVRRRLPSGNRDGVYVGLNRDGAATVTVEVRAPHLPSLIGLERFTSVEFAPEQKEGVHDLTLVLHDDKLRPVFGEFVDYLNRRLEASLGCEDRMKDLKACLQEWSKLFKAGPSGPLSEDEQRGLFAELTFLTEYVLSRTKPSTAVRHWMGPLGTAHDFEGEAADVELKSTSRYEPSVVSISSFKQLANRDSRALYLVAISLEDSESGETLPELIDSMRDELRPHSVAAKEFESRLAAARYFDVHATKYSRSWAVDSEWCSLVDDNFPRIIKVNPSIVGGHYQIDMATVGHSTYRPVETSGAALLESN